MPLKEKVVLVTGSGGGIGKAIALGFGREGAKVVVSGRSEGNIQDTKNEIIAMGAEAIAVKCDVSNLEEIDSLFSKIIGTYGTIDVLVNNVGIAGPTKPVMDIEVEEWDETITVNLRSAFYCIKLAAPYMIKQGGGKIINISSMSGKKSLPNRSPYCASKMGIIGLTRCVAEELGKYNINVNAVCPGPVAGERIKRVFENMARTEGISIDEASQRFFVPSFIKRAADPEDITHAVLFLADDEKSRSITGQDINVNCGAITY